MSDADRDRLPIWVVYRPTTQDYPGEWIARMHLTLPQPCPTSTFLRAATLDGLLAQLPAHLTPIGRQLGDDPVIEGVWL